MKTNNLVKGEAYYIVDSNSQVSQMEYLGYHSESNKYAFNALPFCNAVAGRKWVTPNTMQICLPLGKPNTGREFDTAIAAMLE